MRWRLRVKPEKKTLESFQKLGSDLVKFCGAMLYSIYDLIRNYMDHEVEPKSYWDKKGSMVRDEQELVTMLNDLYKDIAVALLYRARAIEEKINHIRIADREEAEELLTIKVPGGLQRRGNGLAHAMAPIVPVTQRIPLEVINLYAAPYTDKLNLYDEYAKTLLPGDPYYFKEDGGESILAKIKNAIVGFFKGLIDHIARFAGNASFQKAAEWVKKHRSELEALDPVPPITVKDYADKIKIDDFRGTIDHLKTHFTKEVLKDKTSFERFKTGLYESRPELLAMINNKDLGSDKVALAYKNHILFNKQITEGSAQEVPDVELTDGNEIRRRLRNWIVTVVDGPETVNKFGELMKTYQSTVQDCLDKSTSWSKEIADETKKDQDSGSSGDEAPAIKPVENSDQKNIGSGADRGASHESSADGKTAFEWHTAESFDLSGFLRDSMMFTEDENQESTMKDLSAEVFKEMMSCFQITIAPAYQSLQQAIRDQYKYIQDVYYAAKGKKKEEE